MQEHILQERDSSMEHWQLMRQKKVDELAQIQEDIKNIDARLRSLRKKKYKQEREARRQELLSQQEKWDSLMKCADVAATQQAALRQFIEKYHRLDPRELGVLQWNSNARKAPSRKEFFVIQRELGAIIDRPYYSSQSFRCFCADSTIWSSSSMIVFYLDKRKSHAKNSWNNKSEVYKDERVYPIYPRGTDKRCKSCDFFA